MADLTVSINGIHSGPYMIKEIIPSITHIKVGGDFEGSIKLFRIYDGFVGRETFSRYIKCKVRFT